MHQLVTTRAAGNLEAADPGLPARQRRNSVVLIYVPEGAIIAWVHVHRGVVAPAAGPSRL